MHMIMLSCYERLTKWLPNLHDSKKKGFVMMYITIRSVVTIFAIKTNKKVKIEIPKTLLLVCLKRRVSKTQIVTIFGKF
mgnify:CR=1 FL=1